MLVHFATAPALRFMTAGGNDKGRAGFTSRVLIVTEVDGFDEVGGNSRETDKFGQLEGRVRAFTKCQPLVYGECTVSIDTGRIWREYSNGTESRLAIRCPHCLHFVTPAREQLVGWQDAPDIITAGEKAGCAAPTAAPPGAKPIAPPPIAIAAGAQGPVDQRRRRVEGDCPRTDTLGFRWTGEQPARRCADVGREEWRAKQDPDEENAEKKLLQFVWALPHKPERSTSPSSTRKSSPTASRRIPRPRAVRCARPHDRHRRRPVRCVTGPRSRGATSLRVTPHVRLRRARGEE
jgi:hypothetical protein